MSAPPRVAVILVNALDYAQRHLAACYESLLRQTYAADRLTIFLVHNGVSEEQQQLARRLAPGARVLVNERNVGWGAGNNTALRAALVEGCEYCVMLNMDTVVEPEWLQRLVEDAQRRPACHILQSLLMLFGSDRINSLGNRLQYLGYGYCQGYGRPRDAAPRPDTTVDYASGASMLVKREVFERVGLFREDYFLYYDDAEFCWRARLAGFTVGVTESSVCFHKYTFKTTPKLLYYFQRNRLLTLLTLERLGSLLLVLPCLLVAETLVGLYFISRGWGGMCWRLWRYFLCYGTWRDIRCRRRAIGRLRTVPDARLVKQFAGSVTFAEVLHPAFRYLLNPLLQLYWALVRHFIAW